jgi:hypothetical protein
MKGKRNTEEQIIGILKTYETGAKLADLIRKHDISEELRGRIHCCCNRSLPTK